MDEETDNLWPFLVFVLPQSTYWKTIEVEPAHQLQPQTSTLSQPFPNSVSSPDPSPLYQNHRNPPHFILLLPSKNLSEQNICQTIKLRGERKRETSFSSVKGQTALTASLETREKLHSSGELHEFIRRSFPVNCSGWSMANVREGNHK